MDWARRRLGVLAAHLTPDATAEARTAGANDHHQPHQSARCPPCAPASPDAPLPHLSRCPTSGGAGGCSGCGGAAGSSNNDNSSRGDGCDANLPYATADASGAPSAYARTHGAVSRAPAVWHAIPSVAREALEDVIYEKAEGEGIAKVSRVGTLGRRTSRENHFFRRHHSNKTLTLARKTKNARALSKTKTQKKQQITINRPDRRNAFTPRTVHELSLCFNDSRDDPRVGVVLLTGAGDLAFCSGGDQAARSARGGYVGADGVPRLSVLDLQTQIRRLPKPVVAVVRGYAVGGGHVLHMVCDLTLAADNAVFGQTGPKVGSFDAGYGCTAMARLVGQKRAREMWFLARLYSARQALGMGLVNAVFPLRELEGESVAWAREMLRNSPTALRLCKAALNAAEDGHAGVQQLGGDATLLFYQSAEGEEGRTAYAERRRPDFSRFPRLP